MGAPFNPAALFECLKAETSPYAVRGRPTRNWSFVLVSTFRSRSIFPCHSSGALEKIDGWVARQSGAFERASGTLLDGSKGSC